MTRNELHPRRTSRLVERVHAEIDELELTATPGVGNPRLVRRHCELAACVDLFWGDDPAADQQPAAPARGMCSSGDSEADGPLNEYVSGSS